MLVLLFSLLIIITLLFLLSMVWPPDSPWSPWWRTSPKVAHTECDLSKIKKGDVVYDLGCGEGIALVTAAKEYGARGVGIEIDPLRVFTAKLRAKFAGVSDRVEIRRDSFWNQDVSEASVVFLYLIPRTLIKLLPKLLKELKPGTRVVSFVYKIDLPLIAKDEKAEVYVYEIPKRKH